MLNQADFKNRFIAKMIKIIGQYEPYFEFAAMGAYSMYKEDPEDMTPEDHASDEYSLWTK
jgi:hypothetical protein